jgi:hypothetical protein
VVLVDPEPANTSTITRTITSSTITSTTTELEVREPDHNKADHNSNGSGAVYSISIKDFVQDKKIRNRKKKEQQKLCINEIEHQTSTI